MVRGGSGAGVCVSGSWNACLGCGFVVFGKGLIGFRVSSFGVYFCCSLLVLWCLW